MGAAASKGAADAALKGSECLGADTLLQLLKNYARSADIKTSITVGVVSCGVMEGEQEWGAGMGEQE